MSDEEDDHELLEESLYAVAWRVGDRIEVRPRRGFEALDRAAPEELVDIWKLVGDVQREQAPAGANIELVTGLGSPLVIWLRPFKASPAPAASVDLSPIPSAIQLEALLELRKSRERGERRGLVVLAPGLGKTLLSAFDFKATGWRRALFIAHRAEILEQARVAWSRVLPDRACGRWFGGQRERGADLVFASIQTLARPETLASIEPGELDYVIVDEFHHAAAETYGRLLDHLDPKYLLGLTATPQRADRAEILALCDENLVYRAGLRAGLASGRLVPFHYYAVMDGIDYEPIPWRSGRFDEQALTQALATVDHASAAVAALEARVPAAGRRLVVFCCSVAHADFMADFLRAQGMAAAAVHSRLAASSRLETLQRFRTGELVALTAVDLLNEGVDVPDINAVLMLRPTDSPVVFLQQIGRGLRIAPGKSRLSVVDLVGNHRAYFDRLGALQSLIADDLERLDVLRGLRTGRLDAPPGCLVEVPTEFVEVLERLCARELEAESRARVLASRPPIRLSVTHNSKNPILILDRERRSDTPWDATKVVVDGVEHVLYFRKIAVNVAHKTGTKGNVLPSLLRGWFGSTAGWGRDFVTLSPEGDGWRLDPVRSGPAPIRHGVPYYRDLAVACGIGSLTHDEPRPEMIAIRSQVDIDPRRHFVVRAEGDSMNGGDEPIRDGDLVLCERVSRTSLIERVRQRCLLALHDGPNSTEVVLKILIRSRDQWWLRSQAPDVADRSLPSHLHIRVLGQVLGTVHWHSGPVRMVPPPSR